MAREKKIGKPANSMFTPELVRDVQSIKIPVDIFNITYHEFLDSKPPFVAIEFPESGWIAMNEEERFKMATYFKIVKQIFKAHGVNATLAPLHDVASHRDRSWW